MHTVSDRSMLSERYIPIHLDVGDGCHDLRGHNVIDFRALGGRFLGWYHQSAGRRVVLTSSSSPPPPILLGQRSSEDCGRAAAGTVRALKAWSSSETGAVAAPEALTLARKPAEASSSGVQFQSPTMIHGMRSSWTNTAICANRPGFTPLPGPLPAYTQWQVPILEILCQ